jgi:hypothetical protein
MENEYLPIIRRRKNRYYVFINGNIEYLRLDTIVYKKRLRKPRKSRKSRSIDNGYIREGMLSSSEIEDRIRKENETGYFVNVNELNTHLISTSKNVPHEIQNIFFSYLKPPSVDNEGSPIYESPSASPIIVSPRSSSPSPNSRSPRSVSQEKKEERAGKKINKFMKLYVKGLIANKSRGGNKSRTKRGTRRRNSRK